MLLGPNSDPTIWILPQKLRLIRWGNVFLVFCCPILLWCGLLLLQLICRFDMLCIQRWSFAYLGCKEFIWVTVAFLTTWKTVPILLWHQQSILTQNCCSLDIFFFFGPFFVKPRADYVGKSPKTSSFWNAQTSLSATNNPVTFKLTEITLLPRFDARFELQEFVLSMCSCLNALSCLIVWLEWIMNRINEELNWHT